VSTEHPTPEPGANEKLRSARLARGWDSQEQATDEINLVAATIPAAKGWSVSVRTYRRWESSDPGWPRYPAMLVLTAAFGRDSRALGFTKPPSSEPTAHQEQPLDRRHFLAASSAVALAALTPAGPVRKHVDPDLVPYFYKQLDGHYMADMMLGSRDLIGTVTEQYKLIASLARSAEGTTRTELLKAGATYAELCGWLHQDSGEWDASAYWHGLAQNDARMAADPDLVAYTLSNTAHLRVDLGDGRAAVDLCGAALVEQRHLSPRIRVNVMAQQAHGHALLGDRRSVDHLLDSAAGHIEQIDPAVQWGTAARRNQHYFEVQRATCYGRMGLHREGLRLWEEITATQPVNARRDNGVYLARQATAYAAIGEPEHAISLARESALIAADTGSARHRAELVRLRAEMTPWTDHPLGQDLDEALAPTAA
jgi:tetratricopeptide (TPR) repeat protein